jgi:hypothetical protein
MGQSKLEIFLDGKLSWCVDSTLLKLLKEFWIKDMKTADVWNTHHVMVLR